MKEFFSISEAAKMVDMTTETLRHYDRINLVKPCKVDEWTGYRYYSRQEIVRLNTIKALRCMDLTLQEIKEILSYDDLNKIVEAFRQAEKNADKKIAELNYAKQKIRRARLSYERQSGDGQLSESPFIKYQQRRVILLSESMETPTLDNLVDYHRHFYGQLPESMREDFSFEDLAGIYEQNGRRRLFAVCTRYRQTDGIKILPEGRYLCADCTEVNRAQTTENLINIARNRYGAAPEFAVQTVVVSGILQWNYQAQIFLSK